VFISLIGFIILKLLRKSPSGLNSKDAPDLVVGLCLPINLAELKVNVFWLFKYSTFLSPKTKSVLKKVC
jgi:hypothetical protein